MTRELLDMDHIVIVVDIRPPQISNKNLFFIRGDLTLGPIPHHVFENVDAVFHLVGSSIFKRWSKRIKNEIYRSRIASSENLVKSIQLSKHKPRVVIGTSTVGYYGNRDQEFLVESSVPGDTFYARTAVDMENTLNRLQSEGVRVVLFRAASILGKGSILYLTTAFARLFLGVWSGTGNESVPWIHKKDFIRAYMAAFEDNSWHGAYNIAAPQIVTNKLFIQSIARIVHRPVFYLPKRVIRFMFGEFSEELLSSRRVGSERLAVHGFRFSFPTLKEALIDCLTKK